jgi:hypothetical protein
MVWAILDSAGDLIESFDSEDEARRVLERIARDEPEAADEVVLMGFDESGMPVGEGIVASKAHGALA